MNRYIALAVIVILVAGAAGFGLSWWLNRPEAPQALEIERPEYRPDFTLPNMAGEPTAISAYDGKALLVNFWATWCPPCRREIPLLKALQTEYGDDGLQVIGIAVDEMDLVRDYNREMAFNYPVLVGQEDAVAVAEGFGIELYGLPFSVITDKNGKILRIHQGEITEDEADKLVALALGKKEGRESKD